MPGIEDIYVHKVTLLSMGNDPINLIARCVYSANRLLADIKNLKDSIDELPIDESMMLFMRSIDGLERTIPSRQFLVKLLGKKVNVYNSYTQCTLEFKIDRQATPKEIVWWRRQHR